MGVYKKYKKRKLGGGGGTETSGKSSKSNIGAGQWLALQQAFDGGLDTVSSIGQDSFMEKTGATQEQNDIVFKNSNKLSSIPILGNQIGAGIDAINMMTGKTQGRLDQLKKDQALTHIEDSRDYTNDAMVTFALGGNLDEFVGPSHNEGGIELNPETEVEGNETMFNNEYIFSDRLTPNNSKKTYAQLSKRLKNKYTGKRPTDKISKEAEDRELNKLMEDQELTRSMIMDEAYEKAYGGYKNQSYKGKRKMFRGGPYKTPSMMDVSSTNQSSGEYTPSNLFGEDPGLLMNYLINNQDNPQKIQEGISKANANNLPTYGFKTPTTAPDVDLPNHTPQSGLSTENARIAAELPFDQEAVDQLSVLQKPKTSKEESSLGDANWIDYASMGAGVLSSLIDFSQNRKIDPVNYRRYKPKTINMDKARINADKAINTQLSTTANSIRNNAPSTGSYLANRRALGIKGAEQAGMTNANIDQQEETLNNQILNQAEQLNTDIANREIVDYAQNKGQVLNNRSQAAQNLYTMLAGSGSTYKKYQIQKMIAKQLGTNDFKVNPDGSVTYRDTNGKTVTEKISID